MYLSVSGSYALVLYILSLSGISWLFDERQCCTLKRFVSIPGSERCTVTSRRMTTSFAWRKEMRLLCWKNVTTAGTWEHLHRPTYLEHFLGIMSRKFLNGKPPFFYGNTGSLFLRRTHCVKENRKLKFSSCPTAFVRKKMRTVASKFQGKKNHTWQL